MPFSLDLRDLLAASALSATCFAAGVLIPAFGPLLGFFACGPLIWLTMRHGSPAGALGGLLAAAALLSVIPPPAVLFYGLEHAFPGWYLGNRFTRGKGIISSSVQTAVVVAASLLAVSLIWFGDQDRDLRSFFDEQIRTGFQEMGGGLAGSGSEGGAQKVPPELMTFLDAMRRVFPALILIGIFIECALNSLIVLRLLARSRSPVVPEPILTDFALPDWLIWVLIPGLAGAWWPRREVATAALNLILPLLFCYLLQGLSVALSLLQRIRLSRFGLTLLALGLLLQPYLLAVPLLLGLLDFRFDFRRRWTPRPPAPT